MPEPAPHKTSDPTSGKRRSLGRKELLAAVLLLTMFALFGRVVVVFWQEGDMICRALEGELAQFPTSKKPCTKRIFLVGHVDWPGLRGPEANVAASSVRYSFGDDAELLRIETDQGDDGTTDITYRCSTLGKILMPLTNYAAWSSYSTFEGLSQQSAVPTERSVDDGGKGVEGLRTRVTVVGEPVSSRVLIIKSSTRDADDRLRRRVQQSVVPGPQVGPLSISNYEYDRRGNLSSRRQTRVDHPYSITYQTDYTYECWE